MSRMDSTLLHVPMYVKAQTPDKLIRAMIQQNVKDAITHKYFEIQKQGKDWFAWYLGDANKLVKRDTERALNEGKSND